jgi:serine/threonine protein kinase
VYTALLHPDSGPVALKLIPKSNIKSESDLKQLQLELDTMAFVRHPNICCLHTFFEEPEFYGLVLDYCPGGNLEERIAKHGPLPEDQAAGIFHQIVSGVQSCHLMSVAHRDLKLSNFLITTFPNIKIADFGLAGHFGDRRMSTFCGSPAYIAPECLSMKPYDGELSDCWSLGVILYEMVTGASPWQLENIPKMVEQIKAVKYSFPRSVGPRCAELVRSLLKKQPNERLRCAQILAHPWLRMAHARASKSLPPISATKSGRRESLLALTLSLRRDVSPHKVTVVSPFGSSESARDSEHNETFSITRSRSIDFERLPNLVGKKRSLTARTPGSTSPG